MLTALIAPTLHVAAPCTALGLLTVGVKTKRYSMMLAALWLCFLALFFHHKIAGYHLWGEYFDYRNTASYTLSIAVLLVSSLYLHRRTFNGPDRLLRYMSDGITAILWLIGIILVINLWINAYFVETALQGTSIIRVTNDRALSPCAKKSVYYKVGLDGNISYLCPSQRGLIPTIVHLDKVPDHIVGQLGTI